MKYILIMVLSLSCFSFKISIRHNADDILGKWMSAENNLEVEVFKIGTEYKAKIIWFKDSDDKSSPMSERLDKLNRNRSLRNRKILGMEVMHGLVYNEDDDEWQNGRIYDASSGKDWDAKAWLNEEGGLKVRGYWHFSIFGETMKFNRVYNDNIGTNTL